MPLVLDEKRYAVAGNAAAGFRIDGAEADVYTPMGQNTLGLMRSGGAHPVAAMARLRPGGDLGPSLGGADADWRASGGAISRHECRAQLRSRSARCGRCAVHSMAVAGRRQPGAAHRLRKYRQSAAGACSIARARTGHARGAGSLPRPAGAPMSDGERRVGAFRRFTRRIARSLRRPPICGLLAGQFAARRRGAARLACAAVCVRRLARQRFLFLGWRRPCAFQRATWSGCCGPERGA